MHSPVITYLLTPAPSVIESFTSTEAATEGALSDSATLFEEEIFEPLDDAPFAHIPNYLICSLVQAVYYRPGFAECIRETIGTGPIGDTQFTVEDIELFAQEIIPVLSPPSSPIPSLHSQSFSIHSGEGQATSATASSTSSIQGSSL